MGFLGLPINDPLAWLILGAILFITELLAPGFFLMWVGGAALLTGLVALIVPIGSALQLILFAISAIGSVYAGMHWFGTNRTPSEDPLLNNRTARMVGDIVTVVEPIKGGAGRVKIGDSVWSARGTDAPAGASVRIVAVDGGIVRVEPV
jgi:inner membrane protein